MHNTVKNRLLEISRKIDDAVQYTRSGNIIFNVDKLKELKIEKDLSNFFQQFSMSSILNIVFLLPVNNYSPLKVDMFYFDAMHIRLLVMSACLGVQDTFLKNLRLGKFSVASYDSGVIASIRINEEIIGYYNADVIASIKINEEATDLLRDFVKIMVISIIKNVISSDQIRNACLGHCINFLSYNAIEMMRYNFLQQCKIQLHCDDTKKQEVYKNYDKCFRQCARGMLKSYEIMFEYFMTVLLQSIDLHVTQLVNEEYCNKEQSIQVTIAAPEGCFVKKEGVYKSFYSDAETQEVPFSCALSADV